MNAVITKTFVSVEDASMDREVTVVDVAMGIKLLNQEHIVLVGLIPINSANTLLVLLVNGIMV